jgi:hypothetical protein
LNTELFWSIEDARVKLEKWRLDYIFGDRTAPWANAAGGKLPKALAE